MTFWLADKFLEDVTEEEAGSPADEDDRLACGLFDNGMPGSSMCGSCGNHTVGVGQSCSCGGVGIDKHAPA